MKIKNYKILLIYFLIFLFTTFFLLKISKKKIEGLDIFIFSWFIFEILIAIFEFLLFIKEKYIVEKNKNEKTKNENILNENLEFKKSFHEDYWIDLWREYGNHCDKRYVESRNFIHWIELLHGISSLPFIYLIYKYIAGISFSHTDAIIMIIVGLMHSWGTVLYLITLYYNIKNNAKDTKLSLKFFLYKSLNYIWILMPILVIVKGIRILK